MPQKYRGALTRPDIMTDATVNVFASRFTQIGEVKIGAGIWYTLGYGFSASQGDAEGRIYAIFQTAVPAEVKGTLRIEAFTPDDRNIAVLFESRTEALNSSATDRTKQIPFPEMMQALGEDYKFKFFFKADADNVLTSANCTIVIDITKESKSG